MKKIGRIKLNSINDNELSRRELKALSGATSCQCLCAYDTYVTAGTFGEASNGGGFCGCGCSCSTEVESAGNYGRADLNGTVH